jgi:luciferase family oxidoreductase group 1
MSIPYSILDLSPIPQGFTATDALHNSRDLAQHAEKWGFTRYWMAEHHTRTGNASSATAVALCYVAAGTSKIRIGSGGIMLPNHAPLMVAEQFGTLAAFHPGRIDLGLGRGINSDPRTMQALRRTPGDVEAFPQKVQELLGYIRGGGPVRAVPGEGMDVPVWILGSSFGGAALAASMGLPFAYASHFAPDQLDVALSTYRARFTPSAQQQKPHVMLSLTVIVADTDEEAQLLFSSAQQASDGPLQPPIPDYMQSLPPQRAEIITKMFRHAAVGSPATVKAALTAFRERYKPDEIIATAQIFDQRARLKSWEMLGAIMAD